MSALSFEILRYPIYVEKIFLSAQSITKKWNRYKSELFKITKFSRVMNECVMMTRTSGGTKGIKTSSWLKIGRVGIFSTSFSVSPPFIAIDFFFYFHSTSIIISMIKVGSWLDVELLIMKNLNKIEIGIFHSCPEWTTPTFFSFWFVISSTMIGFSFQCPRRS